LKIKKIKSDKSNQQAFKPIIKYGKIGLEVAIETLWNGSTTVSSGELSAESRSARKFRITVPSIN
jgi:hypothetical protein